MGKAKKILVVDDDVDILDQVSMLLKAEGYEVISAGGETEAEEALLAAKPDLAVLDLMMEQMDSGFVLAHRIKKMYPSVPVIILTAVHAATGLDFKAQNPDERAWIKAEVLLDKPVRGEQLKSEIKRLLGA